MTYKLAPGDAPAAMETLAECAGWLVDQFADNEGDSELESFGYLQRVLDEQCYRIPELEERGVARSLCAECHHSEVCEMPDSGHRPGPLHPVSPRNNR